MGSQSHSDVFKTLSNPFESGFRKVFNRIRKKLKEYMNKKLISSLYECGWIKYRKVKRAFSEKKESTPVNWLSICLVKLMRSHSIPPLACSERAGKNVFSGPIINRPGI